MALKLIIGNKNYSSWSFRPWIAMKALGIAFEEQVVPLGDPDFKATILKLSPAGKVPVLLDGDARVWETIAILEHLAEAFPDAGMWPLQRAARSHARALAAEMHVGFAALRRECPMNFWRPVRPMRLSEEARADVSRIDTMWRESRERFGRDGAFLFGPFTAADAMYAPVVSRFHTYAVEVGLASRDYMVAMMALPGWREWKEAAVREPWVLPHDEPDWPTVLREG